MMDESWLQVIGNKLFFNSVVNRIKQGPEKLMPVMRGSTVLRLV